MTTNALKRNELMPRTEALRRTAQRRRECQKAESCWITLGRNVRKDLADHVPSALGMSARDWLEKNFASSRSRIMDAIKITRALVGVPPERLKRIPERNASQLARLPETVRKREEWLSKAEKAPVAEFKEAVTAERERISGMLRPQFKPWTIVLPLDVWQLWDQAFEKMATEVLGVDTEKKGFEITVIEAIAQLIRDTPIERLKEETEGVDEGQIQAMNLNSNA